MKYDQISDILLERYLLKELPEKRIRAIRKEIEQNPEIRQRLKKLEISNNEIMGRYNSELVASEITRRYNAEKKEISRTDKNRQLKRYALPAFALATAAVVLIIFIPGLNNIYNTMTMKGTTEITRIKGIKSGLFIYRKTNNHAEILHDGSKANENDLLQIAYLSTEDTHGIILSIDGRGTVTLHYPENSRASTALATNKKTLLASAYQLDDAPEFERFYMITSKKDINIGKILHAAKALAMKNTTEGDIVTDNSLKQISITIRKGE